MFFDEMLKNRTPEQKEADRLAMIERRKKEAEQKEADERAIMEMEEAIRESEEAQEAIAGGGRPWVCPTKARVYYSGKQREEMAGLELKRASWNQANILEYRLNGEKISKGKGQKLLDAQPDFLCVVDKDKE